MLSVSYSVFTFFIVLIVLFGYRRVLHSMALTAKVRSKKFTVALVVLVIWISYLTILSRTTILRDLNMPPKFPLLIFLPLVLGMILFYRQSKNSGVVHAIPRSWPIYFQSFRIVVEILILFTFFEGILPKSATFEGMNFDVIMGVSAPFVGAYVVKYPHRKKIQYIWNIVGIFMVLFVGFIIASSMYFPSIWNSTTALVSMQFVEMPYLLLAGFLAPIAIFMHVVSLVQLRK